MEGHDQPPRRSFGQDISGLPWLATQKRSSRSSTTARYMWMYQHYHHKTWSTSQAHGHSSSGELTLLVLSMKHQESLNSYRGNRLLYQMGWSWGSCSHIQRNNYQICMETNCLSFRSTPHHHKRQWQTVRQESIHEIVPRKGDSTEFHLSSSPTGQRSGRSN